MTASPSLGTWLGSGVVLVVASVLWFAPWSRFIGHRRRVRPLIPARYKRRLGRIGGWSLMALGMGVIVVSVWGVFVSSVGSVWRGSPPCSLFEIGCYEIPRSGPAILIEVAPYRVPAFSLVLWLGIAFGLSTLVWGLLELRLDPRRAIRQLIQAAVVVAVLGILIAPGYPGVGTFQATVSVIVLAVAVPVFFLRNVLAGWLAEPLRSRYALHAGMASSVILGAWTFVLASVNPIGCQGGVRCAAELRSATLLALAAAAAGLYLVYARSTATRPATRTHDESQIEVREL